MKRGSVTLVAITVAASLSACSTSPKGPMDRSGEGVKDYFEAKRNYARTLEQALQVRESNKYRLVAVVGPAYPIGAILDPDNPVDLVTRNCLLPAAALPSPNEWSAIPSWSSKYEFGLTAKLPDAITRSLLSASLKVDPASTASYSLQTVSQQLVPHAEFVRYLSNEQCQNDLAKADVLAVRGIVSAIEVLSNVRSGGIEASATSKVIENLSLKYNSTGGFEIKDVAAAPKFLILTRINASSRSGTLEEAFVSPTDADISKLESKLH